MSKDDWFLREQSALRMLASVFGESPIQHLYGYERRKTHPRVMFGSKVFSHEFSIKNKTLEFAAALLGEGPVALEKPQCFLHQSLIYRRRAVFSALLEVSSFDSEYARRLWPLLFKKNDSLADCTELLLYWSLRRSGLLARPVKPTKKKTPDFRVETSIGDVFIECKAVLTDDDSESEDVESVIHQRVAKLATTRRLSVSVGLKCTCPLRKNSTNDLWNAVADAMIEAEACRSSLITREFKDGVTVIAQAISRDMTSNMPEGYSMRLEVPLIQDGLFLWEHLLDAGYVAAPAWNLEMSFAFLSDRSRELWKPRRIVDAIKAASDQIRSAGRGIIFLSIQTPGRTWPEVLAQIDEAQKVTHEWLNRHYRDHLLSVVLSFEAVEYLRGIKDRSLIDAVRVITENVSYFPRNAILNALNHQERRGFGTAFPDEKIQIIDIPGEIAKQWKVTRGLQSARPP